ncbi:MAG: hypothetical protein DMG14_03960 [Acidobacteria bacterium]|nr:MAG: hypothetical protein DMG14_03960 [Acidobacteriota bacterium]
MAKTSRYSVGRGTIHTIHTQFNTGYTVTKKTLGLILLTCATAAAFQDQRTQQVWSGRLSDSMCGASHQMRAAGKMSERECLFECIKALAKYVLVDDKEQIIPIANQDLGGFPLYAGRPVRITGEMKNRAILAAKVEAIPAHLHLGHVMTNWRDTPSNVGFLIVAVADGKVAAIHADLAVKSSNNLDEMKLHAVHVLNALDSGIEQKGPGSGYGVKKAATGALQHLEFAVNAEGASANIKMLAMKVSALLNDVLQWTDRAITIAQKIRTAASAPEAATMANELATLTKQISEGGLQQAKTNMDLIMKREGLENAPR